MLIKKRKKSRRQQRRPLAVEALVNRNLLSGSPTWVPTDVAHPIHDKDVDVGPQVTTAPACTRLNAYLESSAGGISESGSVTDALSADATVVVTGYVVGKARNVGSRTSATVDQVNATGTVSGDQFKTVDTATQALASASYSIDGTGIGNFTLTVGAHVAHMHVYQVGETVETTTNTSDADAEVKIMVVGTFHVSIQAYAGDEQHDGRWNNNSNDSFRSERGTGSITVLVESTGPYSVRSKGLTAVRNVGNQDYGGDPFGWQNLSETDANFTTVGTRGTVTFARVAERSQLSGMAGDQLAKETSYSGSANLWSQGKPLISTSNGGFNVIWNGETKDKNFAVPKVPANTTDGLSLGYTPPGTVPSAVQKVWQDIAWLDEWLFGNSI